MGRCVDVDNTNEINKTQCINFCELQNLVTCHCTGNSIVYTAMTTSHPSCAIISNTSISNTSSSFSMSWSAKCN
jgi:hypothetical protein